MSLNHTRRVSSHMPLALSALVMLPTDESTAEIMPWYVRHCFSPAGAQGPGAG